MLASSYSIAYIVEPLSNPDTIGLDSSVFEITQSCDIIIFVMDKSALLMEGVCNYLT